METTNIKTESINNILNQNINFTILILLKLPKWFWSLKPTSLCFWKSLLKHEKPSTYMVTETATYTLSLTQSRCRISPVLRSATQTAHCMRTASVKGSFQTAGQVYGIRWLKVLLQIPNKPSAVFRQFTDDIYWWMLTYTYTSRDAFINQYSK